MKLIYLVLILLNSYSFAEGKITDEIQPIILKSGILNVSAEVQVMQGSEIVPKNDSNLFIIGATSFSIELIQSNPKILKDIFGNNIDLTVSNNPGGCLCNCDLFKFVYINSLKDSLNFSFQECGESVIIEVNKKTNSLYIKLVNEKKANWLKYIKSIRRKIRGYVSKAVEV